jgi:hypothetical protein
MENFKNYYPMVKIKLILYLKDIVGKGLLMEQHISKSEK